MRISDWSSDVCSSDLEYRSHQWLSCSDERRRLYNRSFGGLRQEDRKRESVPDGLRAADRGGAIQRVGRRRSEERRVGKECVSTCRSRWSRIHKKKTNMTQTAHKTSK